jgi:hypothetical protein
MKTAPFSFLFSVSFLIANSIVYRDPIPRVIPFEYHPITKRYWTI